MSANDKLSSSSSLARELDREDMHILRGETPEQERGEILEQQRGETADQQRGETVDQQRRG